MASGVSLFPNGSASAPSIGFINDIDVGFFYAATRIGVTIAGTERYSFNGAGTGMLFTQDNADDVGASGATRPRTIYAGTAIAVGTTPATAGHFRAPTPLTTLATIATPLSQEFHGGTLLVPDNSATTVFTVDCNSDGEKAGGFLDYTLTVTSGSNEQVLVGRLAWAVINDDSTITSSEAVAYELPALCSGGSTLTATWSSTNSGSGTEFQLTADTSLVGESVRITYILTNHSARPITLP